MAITRTHGFLTDDGRMFATLNEAAGHLYAKRLKDAIGKAGGVFGVSTILANSREIAEILRDYNIELDRFEGEANDQL
jgi:hypothetical protein